MPDSKVLINSGYMTWEQIEKENLVILEKRLGLDGIHQRLTNIEEDFDHIREVLRNLGKEVSKIEEKLRNHQGIVSHDGRIMSELEQRMVILQQQIEYIFKYTPVTNDAVKTLQKDVEELKNSKEE